MPRRARQFIDGLPYHVLNRGNRRQRVFSQHTDYEMFLTTLADMRVRQARAGWTRSIEQLAESRDFGKRVGRL